MGVSRGSERRREEKVHTSVELPVVRRSEVDLADKRSKEVVQIGARDSSTWSVRGRALVSSRA
jgi:tRNA threonylcarbamoyladenosine modification (KEOPS) complex  Pcc1 subunit